MDIMGQRRVVSAVLCLNIWPTVSTSLIKWLLCAHKFGVYYIAIENWNFGLKNNIHLYAVFRRLIILKIKAAQRDTGRIKMEIKQNV